MIDYISNKLKELYFKKLEKKEKEEEEIEEKEKDSIKNYIKPAGDVFKGSSRWDDDKEWVYGVNPKSMDNFSINAEDPVEVDYKLDRYSNSNIVYSNQHGIIGSAGYSGHYGIPGRAGTTGYGPSGISGAGYEQSRTFGTGYGPSGTAGTRYGPSATSGTSGGSNGYYKHLSSDRSIKYSKYIAEKSDDNIKYYDYVNKELDKSLNYYDYVTKELDKSLNYYDYVTKELDKSLNYTQYISNMADNIKYYDYCRYLEEQLNNNTKKENRIVSDVDPYGEEDWGQ